MTDETGLQSRILRSRYWYAFIGAYGLLGLPVGVLAIADGAPLVALGCYLAAAGLLGLASTLWIIQGIVEDPHEVETA